MIGLIGNGSWATAIAKILTDNGHKVHWWMRSGEAVKTLESKHHNYPYLSSISFPADKIRATCSLDEVLESCGQLIFCVPSAYLTDILKKIPYEALKDKLIISAIKGILPGINMLLSDYLHRDYGMELEQYVSITGPCHAEEVAMERLSYLTFSCSDIQHAEEVASWFGNSYIHTTINTDIQGTQYAAVLKNIYAVGAGIAHGLGYGDNFTSVYVTNCYKELYHFVDRLSSHDEDYHTSAYLGDLLVTCYSLHSRNRRFGSLLGNGYAIPSAIAEMGMMAEGYFASKGMHHILQEKSSSLPIATAIYTILWEEKLPKPVFRAIEALLK